LKKVLIVSVLLGAVSAVLIRPVFEKVQIIMTTDPPPAYMVKNMEE